ncbi:unnamed protein product [Oppiella nova]|uniref:Uncharacterized protein n=1 Tax=Oppiella nova TaxID=334625 RepID=A0A7R9QEC7_9ACAR|nr:unnamed protein product [Oppiella nova]CAG2163330.1 unnamed protein product [Oppiella nova]
MKFADNGNGGHRSHQSELIKKLKKQIVPKEKNNKPISGVELAALLEILVNAANDGSLADVPNRWDAFVIRLQQTAIEDCLKFYEADMSVLIVDEYDNSAINLNRFDEWHNQSLLRSVELLTQLLHGLDETLTKGLHELEHKINVQFDRNRDINEKKIKLKCSQTLHELEIKSEQSIRAIALPIHTTELLGRAKEVLKSMKTEYINQISDLVDKPTIDQYLDSLSKAIKNQVSSVQLENNNAIEAYFDHRIQESVEKFQSVTISNYSRTKPRKPSLLKRILEEGNIQALDLFNNNCNKYTTESSYESKLAVLKVKLNEQIIELEKQNEKTAETYTQSESNRLLDEFKTRTGASFIPMPSNTTELESRLKLEFSKSIRDYSDLLSDFKVYQSYEQLFQTFKQYIEEVCEQRRAENVKAFTREVEIPLRTSKKIIILSHDRYSTIHSVCLLHLDEGKPKYWSMKLKSEIIDQFITDDQQLLKLIDSKGGLWSAVVGFFQWVLWLLNIG